MDTMFIYPYMDKKINKVKDFLKKHELDLEKDIEFTVAIAEDGEIIATGSISRNVLKCMAVAPLYNGIGLIANVVTELINYSIKNNNDHLFVFTKPKNKNIFESLGFYELARSGEDAILMDNQKDGIFKYLNSLEITDVKENSVIGCVIANCNPFTLGHRYLIENALNNCDFLHLFILEEDKSEFPAEVRYDLVKKGTSHLKNLTIHKASEYIISSATFPTYFLKEKSNAVKVNAILDLEIFCKYIAPFFNIKKRFVGEEPFSHTTSIYNDMMSIILQKNNIQFEKIARCESSTGEIISASLVRKFLKDGNISEVKNFVPKSTLEFLKSSAGEKIIESMRR